MTANSNITTALVVLAVLAALLVTGFGPAQVAAKPALAQAPDSIQAYSTADIDSALASGPVFVEFETKECGYCKQQKPISEALASEYQGKVTFIFVDASEDRDLARQFQVQGVPQMNVIVNQSASGYTFGDKDGQTSPNLAASRFIGLTQQDALKTALDAAVRMRGK